MSSDARQTRSTIVGTAILVEGGLVVLALVLGWMFEYPPLASIEWSPRGLLLGLAAAVPMVLALVLANRFPLGPLAGLDQVVRQTLVPLFRSCTLVDLIVICCLAGLGEELLFRGVVQVGFDILTGSPWLALFVAAVVFGLAHPISTTYSVLAAVIGVYFGWLFLATGNLLVPIVAHASYDLAALVYLLRGGDESGPRSSAGEPSDGWTL